METNIQTKSVYGIDFVTTENYTEDGIVSITEVKSPVRNHSIKYKESITSWLN